MKKQLLHSMDRDGDFMNPLVDGSYEGSRKRLRSIQFATIQMGKACRRYYCHNDKEQSKSIDVSESALQYPTFGDWKMMVKTNICKQKENILRQSNGIKNNSLGTAQKKKNQKRNKLYEQNKIRQIAETVKLRPRTLCSIDNVVTGKFVEKIDESSELKTVRQAKRKLTSKSHSHKNQPLLPKKPDHVDSLEQKLERIVLKKQGFKYLYLKQKQKYERILRKYNIDQKVDDTQFEMFINA